MSEEIDYNFNRDQDVPPEKPVPAGFYEGVVASVRFEVRPEDDKFASGKYANKQCVEISYRLKSDDPDLNGKRIQEFPMPVRGHKDSWRWFDWCGRMGYDTTNFRFDPADVEGAAVTLKFDAPREGKGKNEGKQYDNLVDVQRLA